MWMATRYGFFSVVENRRGPFARKQVMVRTRNAEDLDAFRRVCPSLGPSIFSTKADYPWRAITTKRAFGRALQRMAQDIDYDNFKNTILREQGFDRESVYSGVWSRLRDLEELEYVGNGKFHYKNGRPAWHGYGGSFGGGAYALHDDDYWTPTKKTGKHSSSTSKGGYSYPGQLSDYASGSKTGKHSSVEAVDTADALMRANGWTKKDGVWTNIDAAEEPTPRSTELEWPKRKPEMWEDPPSSLTPLGLLHWEEDYLENNGFTYKPDNDVGLMLSALGIPAPRNVDQFEYVESGIRCPQCETEDTCVLEDSTGHLLGLCTNEHEWEPVER